MKILWDEPKRIANLAKHGIDFADISLEFFINAQIGHAKNGRLFALGRINRVVLVIFCNVGSEAISVISARPASKKERNALL